MTRKSISKPHAVSNVVQIGLLVAGMHRSGTSAVTKIINMLGADLPINLMSAHAEFNAAGYWESQDVVDLNDHLLMMADSCWDDVLPIDLANLSPIDLRKCERRAKEILSRDFNECIWFVLKDPRIGKLLRFWIPAIEAHGAIPRVIIPIRNPLEVAASLQRREGFSEDKSIYLWLRHMVDAIRDSRNVPRAILLFDELMLDWRMTIERLGKDIDVTWLNKLDVVAPTIEQFLDPNLRHHTYKMARPAIGGWVNHLAAELYVTLRERTSNLEELVDSIHDQLVPIENAFAPLQKDNIRKMRLVSKAREQIGVDLSKLSQEFEDKVQHVKLLTHEVGALRDNQAHAQAQLTEYEQTLELERKTHTELVAAFEDKGLHVALLTHEVEDLRDNQAHAQVQLTEYEQTLELERKTHTELVAAFEDKGRHVALLTHEVEALRDNQVHAQAQLTEYEQTLELERKTHTELAVAFEDKGRNIELLTREVEALHDQQKNTQTQVDGLLLALEQAKNTIEKINKII